MERQVRDIPEMYTEMMQLIKMQGVHEDSRNGPVLTLPEPLTVTVREPWNRVLLDRTRCANPFFHVAEFVWMMSGSNELQWIEQFNKGFASYADRDGGLHGAYGHRWRKHFYMDQLDEAVEMLTEDPTTRRVVLGMWDPRYDLNADHADLPCNTHIYLRIVNSRLEMTVCNRSNDLIWGMTGANAVHMTMLHELLAREIGVEQGFYRVFTNNGHIYTDLPSVDKMLEATVVHRGTYEPPMPLLGPPGMTSMHDFIGDCERLVQDNSELMFTPWMKDVARPMIRLYLARRQGHDWSMRDVDDIKCPQWGQAAHQWLQAKQT